MLDADGERRAPERGSVRQDGALLRVQTLDLLNVGAHQTQQPAQTAPLRTAGKITPGKRSLDTPGVLAAGL